MSLHVLTYVFFSACSLTCCASARSLTCCAWVWVSPAPLRRSLLPPPGTVRGSRLPCHQSSVVNHVLWPLLCVARKTSSLEPLPQRSVPQTAVYTFRRLLLSSVSSDRALWSSAGAIELCVFPQLSSLRPAVVQLPASGLRGAHSRRSSEIARSRSCSCSRCSWPLFGFVPRGQRAPLDSDMPLLIDRSACLVEPVVVELLCSPPCLLHVQRRVRPLLCSSELLAPSCSKRSCRKEPFSRVVSQSCAPCLLDALVRLTELTELTALTPSSSQSRSTCASSHSKSHRMLVSRVCRQPAQVPPHDPVS